MVSSDCLLMDARLQEWSVQAPMSDLGMHQLSSYGCQITGMECPSPMPRFMVSSDCLLMDARLQGWSAQAPCPGLCYAPIVFICMPDYMDGVPKPHAQV